MAARRPPSAPRAAHRADPNGRLFLQSAVNLTDEGLLRVKRVGGSAAIVGGGILATHDPVLAADRGACCTRPRARTTDGAAQRPGYLSAPSRRPLDPHSFGPAGAGPILPVSCRCGLGSA